MADVSVIDFGDGGGNRNIKDVNAARSSAIAPIEDGGTSSANYLAGDYIYRNGKLYKVITPISIGDIIGNNIQETKVTKEYGNISIDANPTQGSGNAVSSGGVFTALSNKADTSDIPTNTSQLNNNSGFITNLVNDLANYYLKSETYTRTEVNNIIGTISTISFEVVSSLPTTDIKTNVIYLVPKASAQTSNIKDEYINLDGTTSGWEKIGETIVDVSGKADKVSNATANNFAMLNSSGNLVDSGVSANDFIRDNHLEQTVTLSTQDTTLVTFSNSSITSSSLIDVYVSEWGIIPEDVVTNNGTCAVVMPVVEYEQSVVVRIYVR